jgi:hypothetical protein
MDIKQWLIMHAARRAIFYNALVLIAVVSLVCVACRLIPISSGGIYKPNGEFICPGSSYRPVSIDNVKQAFREQGAALSAVEGSCGYGDSANIHLTNENALQSAEKNTNELRVFRNVLLSCYVRPRSLPTDRNPNDIRTRTFKGWWIYSYQNTECAITSRNTNTTIAQRIALKKVMSRIKARTVNKSARR